MTWIGKLAKRLGIVLSFLGVLALGVAVTPPAQARPGRPPVPTLDWRPCGVDFPGKLCATARVPLDYDEPRGRAIELALEGLYLSRRISKESGGGETIYG